MLFIILTILLIISVLTYIFYRQSHSRWHKKRDTFKHSKNYTFKI